MEHTLNTDLDSEMKASVTVGGVKLHHGVLILLPATGTSHSLLHGLQGEIISLVLISCFCRDRDVQSSRPLDDFHSRRPPVDSEIGSKRMYRRRTPSPPVNPASERYSGEFRNSNRSRGFFGKRGRVRDHVERDRGYQLRGKFLTSYIFI